MNYLYITQILSSPSWTPLPTQREHPPSQVSCWWVVEALATMLMEKSCTISWCKISCINSISTTSTSLSATTMSQLRMGCQGITFFSNNANFQDHCTAKEQALRTCNKTLPCDVTWAP